MQEKTYRPLLLEELSDTLQVSRKKRTAFENLVQTMVREGDLVRIRGDRYALPEKINLVSGTLQSHPDGYGFVIPDREGETDLYIPRRKMMGAMHGDRVVSRVEAVHRDGRREGQIIRVLERSHQKIVGRFERGKNFGFVVPTNRKITYDISIAQKHDLGALSGELVVAQILSYPQKFRNPEGKIVQRLGKPTRPGIETDVAIEEYGLPSEFPPDVIEEAREIPDRVTEEMLSHRVDLRDLRTVTIDGERARDFDDAVSIRRLPHGDIRLWVHIADVGAYVREGSALDREAFARGTSVYFPDRVIPMFPEKLSNGICSLNPKENRLTMTAEMDFDRNGNRLRYHIYDSVIHSDERMTYTAVKKILVDGDQELLERYAPLMEDFHTMEELCRKLRKKRFSRGSIDFDLPEPEILLDLQGRTLDILTAERNIAHQIIEEFMLAANECVALHATSTQIPFLYRIHEPPDEDKILEFNDFIEEIGIRAKLLPRSSKSFQRLLEKLEGKPEEKLISHLMLRSMKQARYAAENVGHFGLAAAHYTHFTSPIRRYPDLVVHRLIREILQKRKLSDRRKFHLSASLPEVGRHTSERERLAMEVEREVVEIKKLQFMADKVGEAYTGIISGVTSFGLFVELEKLLVEGLVRVTSMHDDFYRFEEKRHQLVGSRRNRTFRLGDRVAIRIEKVDLERRQMDFSLAGNGLP
ncbi:MAG: ribonuclease R [Nitrospirae bacterium]|nr:ribonuclease R [Nitrospirota bacterium]